MSPFSFRLFLHSRVKLGPSSDATHSLHERMQLVVHLIARYRYTVALREEYPFKLELNRPLEGSGLLAQESAPFWL